MDTPQYSHLWRRQCLQATFNASVAALAAPLLSACGGKKKALSCSDTSSLTTAELQTRTQLRYVDATPDAMKNCGNCQFYQAGASPEQCGACTLVKGPIHPRGYCISWAAKQS